ncbi:MAG: efflux RND transporter periplasmic adaptor subunit [Halanaerobiales bacterium]|nr:efflux RND transporter periplasmic adaptor subunit [Halanaerobiales bacterium]
MKKKILITILVILVFAGGYFGYTRYYQKNMVNQKEQIDEKNTMEVTTGSMKKTIPVSGNIYPIKEQALSFSTQGTVASVNIEEGDTVSKGDILIELKNNKTKLELIRAENNYKNTQINGSQNAIKEARLNYEIAQENLEETQLKAPFSGVVTELSVQKGDYINSGQKVATLIDNSNYEVKANIDESELADLKVGQDVEISMEALPGLQLTGQLTEISSKAVSTSGVVTVPITVLVDSVNNSFKPGLSADMEIITEFVNDKIIVPVTAIVNREGKKMVQKVIDQKTKLVEVETGLTDGLRIVIQSGLKAGEEIVVNSAGNSNTNNAQNRSNNFSGPPRGGN